MKIVITGSLGHISKPLAEELITKGHSVTVISSNVYRAQDIEALGAKAAIGSVDDIDFLTETLTGADAVYCMVPPNHHEINQVAYYSRTGNNYAEAIRRSGVLRVVELSSYGAHLPSGTGYIVGSHQVEQILNGVPGIALTHVRPGFFYYNLLNFIPMIKTAGFIATNYGGDDKLATVSPIDIATIVAKELLKPSSGINVRYAVSDDRTCTEIAALLGKAVNKPDLQWRVISSEQMHNNLTRNGVPAHIADNLVELGEATHSGALREEYVHEQVTLGKTKLDDFLEEFVRAYNEK